MKYVKEELENLIWVEKLPYVKIAERYNVSDTYIKKIANKLGIPLPRKKIFPVGWTPKNKGTKKHNPVFCINCKKECNYFSRKYCSLKCQQEFQRNKLYKDYLENPEKYCRETYTPTKFKDKFLIDQNNKCSICFIENKWNNKKLVFVLDHIDGNAANNKRENIRLVCPNCDSQLDTFKSKNKNSARKERYLKQRK